MPSCIAYPNKPSREVGRLECESEKIQDLYFGEIFYESLIVTEAQSQGEAGVTDWHDHKPQHCLLLSICTQAMRQRLLLLVLTIVYGHTVSTFTYRDISEKAREKSTYTTLTHASVDDDVPLSLPTLFSPKSSRRNLSRRYCCLVLQANSRGDKENDADGKKGYQFGDFTRSIIGGSIERVRNVHKGFHCSTRHKIFLSASNHCRSQASHTSLEVRMIQVSKRWFILAALFNFGCFG